MRRIEVEKRKMVVIKVKGIEKFESGMCFRRRYAWKGEPTREYHYKITKPDDITKGEGAYYKIQKVIEDGKENKNNRVIGQVGFMWNHETQIGRVKNPSGWGRTVRTDC